MQRIVLFFLLSCAFLLAQESNHILASLDKDALLAKAESFYLVVEKDLKSFTQGSELLNSAQEVLMNIDKQIMLYKEPPKVASIQGATRTEHFARMRDYYISLAKYWEDKKKLLVEEQTHLEQLKKRLNEAEPIAQSLDQSFLQFQLVVTEVEARVTKNEIDKTQAAGYIHNYSVQQILAERDKIKKQINEWQIQLQSFPNALQTIQQEMKNAEDALSQTSKLLEQSIQQFQEVAAQEAISKEFEDKDPGVLVGLLPSMSVENEKLQKELEQNSKDLANNAQYRLEFREIEQGLQKLVPPDTAKLDLQLESRIPSSQNAEKAMKVAKAMLEYQKLRVQILNQYKAKVEDFCTKLKQATSAAQKYRDHLVRNMVLMELLMKLKRDGKIESLPIEHNLLELESKAKMAKDTMVAFQAELKTLEEKLANTTKALEGTQGQLNKTEASFPQLTKAYNEEKAWEKWTQEVETLTTPALIAQFQKTTAEYEQARLKIEKVYSQYNEVQKLQESLITKIRSLENPLQTRSLNTLRKLHDEAKARLQKIVENKQITVSLDLSEEEIRTYQKELGDFTMSLVGTENSKNQPEDYKKYFESQLDFTLSIISSLKQEREIREQQIEQRKNLLAACRDKILIAEEHLATARKLYGAALELQLRIGRKEIIEKDIPTGLAEFAKREGIIALMERIATIKKEQSDIENALAQDNEILQKIIQKRDLLQNRATIITQKLVIIHELANLVCESEWNFSSLSDIEKKRFEQKVQQQIRDDNTILEHFLGYFRSSEINETAEILEGDYRDYMGLQHKMQSLNQRILAKQKLMRLTKEELKVVNDLFTFIALEAKEMKIKGISGLAQIEARVKPSSYQDTLASQVKQKIGTVVSLPNPLENENLTAYLPQAANDVFQIWIQRLSIRAWRDALEFQCSKLGLESEIGKYGLQISEVEAKQQQLSPQLKKLMGHSQADMANLDEDAKPKTADETYQFLYGSIGVTRKAHLRALIWAATVSLFNIIIIPIVAFMLIRLANKIGLKIIERVNRETKEAEREQRAQTLVGVFKAAWASVVIVMAGIYILKQLQIDITPIIASAGVVGLAVAFGAQTLIKDFFYGFFILLENQYAVGDIVQIGNADGIVEKITLRLTILRSLDGTVHFVPNGGINLVSNKSKKFARAVVGVGVDYSSDLNQVLQVLNEVGQSLKEDPEIKQRILNEYEVMGVEEFGDSAINVRMWVKTRPNQQWAVARYTRKKIMEAFNKNGIKIAFPQIVVH